MSKNGLGSLRVMVIDVEGDKILRDELCDAIVAGLARDGDRGKGEKVSGCSFGISKGSVGTMVASCMSADQAVEKAKESCVKKFIETAVQGGLSDLDNLDEMLGKVIDSALGGEDSSDEC